MLFIMNTATKKTTAIVASTALLTLPITLPVITDSVFSAEKAYAAYEKEGWHPTDIIDTYGPAEPRQEDVEAAVALIFGATVIGVSGITAAAIAIHKSRKRDREEEIDKEKQDNSDNSNSEE